MNQKDTDRRIETRRRTGKNTAEKRERNNSHRQSQQHGRRRINKRKKTRQSNQGKQAHMYRRAFESEPPKTPRVAEPQPLSPTRSLPRRHAFIHRKSTCPRKQKQVRTQSRSVNREVERENRVLFGLVRAVSRRFASGRPLLRLRRRLVSKCRSVELSRCRIVEKESNQMRMWPKSRPAQELQRNSRVDDGVGLNLHPAGNVFTHEPLVASVEHVHVVNVVVKLVI